MIESPQALLFEPLPLEDTDSITKNTEPELLLVKEQPITSSFRRTIKHLHSIGGFRARFRGFAIFTVYNIALAWVSQMLGYLPLLPRFIAPALATIALANVSMAWTHIVISEPSPLPWYKRLPPTRLYKKIVGPAAVLAVAEQLAITLPSGLAFVYGMGFSNPTDFSMADQKFLVLKSLSIMLVTLATAVLLVFPANVMLTRVQASLLNDSEEAIVPFDRSFGGKVIPEIVGGTGVLGCVDAWKTFDWNARVRLVKTYAKVFAINMALSIFFFMAFVSELVLIVGMSDLKKMIPSDGKGDEDTSL